jgi:hypothetical protein
MSARQPNQIFILRLRAAPKVDAICALRAALKVLGRRFGLRAISIEAESERPEGQAAEAADSCCQVMGCELVGQCE